MPLGLTTCRKPACPEHKVDPDAFVRWTYARALAHRAPRYRAMADTWGVTVTAEEVARVTDCDSFHRSDRHQAGLKTMPHQTARNPACL